MCRGDYVFRIEIRLKEIGGPRPRDRKFYNEKLYGVSHKYICLTIQVLRTLYSDYICVYDVTPPLVASLFINDMESWSLPLLEVAQWTLWSVRISSVLSRQRNSATAYQALFQANSCALF